MVMNNLKLKKPTEIDFNVAKNIIDEFLNMIKKGTEIKTKDLTEASMKLGEAVYKSQQQEQKPEQETQQTNEQSKDDVVDAEFEEVKK